MSELNSSTELKRQMLDLKDDGDDRVYRFIFRYFNMTPEENQRSLNYIYLYISFVSFVSFLLVLIASISVYNKNMYAEVQIVRIDGVPVSEFKDLRRDILLQNTFERARLNGNKPVSLVDANSDKNMSKKNDIVDGGAELKRVVDEKK